MFKKILIANRGEIACRVMRTARRMGIKTVAVYSEADADALHVEMADEAVLIGPPPAGKSYLNIGNILKAVRKTGAEAVHPGYGFLSENAAFARKLKKEGITFIGPPVAAIAKMGDKIKSKKIAAAAAVNVIPGSGGVLKTARAALAAARKIGYPVMIKASAGGGGKGMRIARNDAQVRRGFALASREAKSSFADERLFIEKFIDNPRHIEIQILADGNGNTIYLGERECSIQRRHQKVIEEAPSPFVDEDTRRAMGEQAVALARAVKYVSAGTVEFIVDAKKNFYFLEMNTRLQVEHPVTEMVTGIDLVEWMIRVAAGQTLALVQEDVDLKGWAIEARVYAEDPGRDFLPSTGRLARYLPPPESGTVRVDTGVAEGDEISVYYDPMIAKVIATGKNRGEAALGLRRALDCFYIQGISHNIVFLAAVVCHPRFIEGRLSTAFIADEYADGFNPAAAVDCDQALLIAVAVVIHYAYQSRAAQISGQIQGHERRVGEDWAAVVKGPEHARARHVIIKAADGGWTVRVGGGRAFKIRTDWKPGEPLLAARVDGLSMTFQFARLGAAYRLIHGGVAAEIMVLNPEAAALYALMPAVAPPDTSRYLLSPMPGLLVSLAAKVGREVKAGDELAGVEAMKMENVLCSERDGKVREI
ncbi:MAG TPA: acetyl/propionyl/methylcrotonyl-CoA carboxylase subunit alpha, partial [Alphaproteobacteria bacterium]|nr:acetyl/propionyl/methylcrotonyl-CoA carboxylase subunit alpha [Alphaproteobacteria bacterium]